MNQNRKTALLLLAATFAISTPAFSQAPSQAQRAAIKSNCRSDYIAHCSSVPPGGAASLQCLQKNMASLSAACAGAVKAAAAPAETKAAEPAAASKETKTETKPEPQPAAKPAAEPAAREAAKPSAKTAAAPGQPSSAQISAVRANCRSDYPKVCAGVPTGGAPALQCLEKNKAKLSAACGKAVAAAAGSAEPAAASTAAPATANANPAAAPAAAAPAAAPALVLRPMRPREVLFVMRSACGADVRALCAGMPAGGGRIIECLAAQPARLSPACRGVLGQFSAR